MPPFNLTQTNPFLPWMEEEPEAMFRAFLPQGQTRSFLDYFRSQYRDIYGDYMGQLAGMGLRGEAPTLQFSTFLSQFPFLSNYLGLGPEQRGERQSLFSPRMRWMV